MNHLIAFINSVACANLVTALLHSLWQAVVIAGLLLVFLKSKAARNSNIRYASALAALTAILLFWLFTWAVLEYEPSATAQAPLHNTSAEKVTATPPLVGTQDKSASVVPPVTEPENVSTATTSLNWQKWVIIAWLIGVVVMLLRVVFTAVGGARLRRGGRALEDEHVSALVEQLRESTGITRRIRVAVSERISVPGVVGCIWPTLLLPTSMISGIPADDLRAIIAHELAHVRRYDYLVNFYQMVVEAIFFFNPAVWWVSRQVRFEREACCDKAVVVATGERIRYAEALAGWAQRLKEASAGATAPAVAFGKPDDSGGTLERMRRILVAGHRPRLKVSWYVAAITLILSMAILVGLWQGTTMTVALAGKLLTPQERINKIREIEKTHPTFEKREYTEEDQITITGNVKTIDGKPLAEPTYARIFVEGPQGSCNSGARISSNGSMSAKVDYGIVWLDIKAKGYAQAFAGPLRTEPGGEIKDLSFILDKGFEAKLRIVNEDNEPVSGARLVGDYKVHPAYSYEDIKLTSDENGLAVVKHAAERPARFTVSAEGYEVEKFEDVRLSAEKPAVLKLTPAKETNGVVFSKVTEEPVPDAEIKVLMVDRESGSHSYGPEQGRLLATTDEKGRFVLKTLRSDSRYLLTVEAEGFGHRILYDVMAGQEDIKIYLPDEMSIKGRIEGPLEKLKKHDGKYFIRYGFGISYDHHSHWSSGKEALVDVRNGKGYFEITDIAGNRVSIGLGSHRKVLNIEKELPEEVLIDLTDPVTTSGQEYQDRELIVRFDYPAEAPAPEGQLIVKYIDPEFASNTYKNEQIAIENGQGRLRIPTPGKVAYDNSGIAGYWFGKKSGIEVPFAEEPFVLTISAVPAGSIYGEVFEHDGSKADNVLVGVVAVEKSPLMGDVPFLDVEGKNSTSEGELDTKYVISPLPLGGKYVVIPHTKDLYVVSDPITLDETQPIRRLDMTLPKGRTFEIKILDENGKPKPAAPVSFGYSTPWSHGFSREESYTNVEGKLVIDRLNPNVPGTYRVVVKDLPGYRPVKKKVEDFDRPLEIKLERGLVVTGIVVDDETGWPIPGAEVYALPTDFSVPEPTTYLDADDATDEQGRFRFSTMARRQYHLHVRSARLASLRDRAVVTGGQQGEITLRVKLSKSSRLKPREPEDGAN